METTLASSQSVFVLELVSAGYFGAGIAPNFRAEGRAMLDAVLDDFRRIPDVAVATLVDQTAEDIHELLLYVLEHLRTDAALIIAPEFDHLLERFCAAACESSAHSLNCDPQALALCADKARFAEHLMEQQIPTIPTQVIDLNAKLCLQSQAELSFPAVVKPRDGAGSWLVRGVHHQEQWSQAAEEFRAAGRTELLCQPWIRGKSYSVAALVTPQRPPELLPVAEQRLSDDGAFHYRGGELPARLSAASARQIQELVRRCVESIPGLMGYIGCDVIVPDSAPQQPLIVELNPRLTTSYIGYRRLCADNLMERLLFPDRFSRPLRWREGMVSFDSDGGCRYAADEARR